MIVLALLFALAVAQTTTPTYTKITTFANGGCTGLQYFVRSIKQPCTVGVTSCTGNVQTTCQTGIPATFENAVQVTLNVAADCSDQFPVEQATLANGICFQSGADSWNAGCSFGNMYALQFTTNNICLGTAYAWQFTGNQCVRVPASNLPFFNSSTGAYAFARCSPVCFHKDSEIASPVTGKTMTLESLKRGEHPECHVPHELKAHGVVIRHSCGPKALRLTGDHLVITPAGQVAASTLKKGDTLFRTVEKTHSCEVLSVEQESQIQDYFALNCAKSTVVTDGVATSTFGKHHTIPAMWMSWLSPVLGVQRASAWGDKVVSFLNNLNLV